MKFILGIILLFNGINFVAAVNKDRGLCMSDLTFKDAPIIVQLGWGGMYTGIKIRESKRCK